MADADEDDGLQALAAEHFGDLVPQLRDVVAQPPRAEVTKASEVLAELSGFHAGSVRERLARHSLHAVFTELIEAAQVHAEPIDSFSGNRRSHLRPMRAQSNDRIADCPVMALRRIVQPLPRALLGPPVSARCTGWFRPQG